MGTWSFGRAILDWNGRIPFENLPNIWNKWWTVILNNSNSRKVLTSSSNVSRNSTAYPKLMIFVKAFAFIFFGFFLSSTIIVVLDSMYFGSPQLTVLNSFLYNLDPANLAEHGIHPRYLHSLVNMNILFGPLYLHACFNILSFFFFNLKEFIKAPIHFVRTNTRANNEVDHQSGDNQKLNANLSSEPFQRLRNRLEGSGIGSKIVSNHGAFVLRTSEGDIENKSYRKGRANVVRFVLLGCIICSCFLLSVAKHQVLSTSVFLSFFLYIYFLI